MNSTCTLDDIEALRRQVEALAKERDDAIDAAKKLAEKNTSLTTRLERAKTTIRQLKHALYGRRSEKLTGEELEALGQVMFEFAGTECRGPDGEPLIPVAPVEDTKPDDEPKPNPKRRRERRRTMSVSECAERVVTPVCVPETERRCSHCGEEMTLFGVVEHKTIEVVPAKVVVHVEQREKLACKRSGCKGEAITAERRSVPDSPLRVGTSVLVHLIEGKCDDARVPRRPIRLPQGRWRKSCCMDDEGWPLGIGVQARVPNRPELRGSKARVVSVGGNGATGSRQVRSKKTSESEPLMTCRKAQNNVETGRVHWPGMSPDGACLLAGRRSA